MFYVTCKILIRVLKLEKVEKNLQECQNELDEVGKKLRNRKDSLPPRYALTYVHMLQ